MMKFMQLFFSLVCVITGIAIIGSTAPNPYGIISGLFVSLMGGFGLYDLTQD